jgi:hypothetical protein
VVNLAMCTGPSLAIGADPTVIRTA